MASIGYNREGYKTSTQTTVKDRKGSKQVEHFDGRVDAQVNVKAVSLKAHKQGDK